MDETQKVKPYNLEERTFEFAQDVREFVGKLPKIVANIEDGRQLIRSSGSVGANYIEASESLSKKDFYLRIKICRKEAKESRYWLKLINTGGNTDLKKESSYLADEATEFMKIFGSIITRGS